MEEGNQKTTAKKRTGTKNTDCPYEEGTAGNLVPKALQPVQNYL